MATAACPSAELLKLAGELLSVGGPGGRFLRTAAHLRVPMSQG